MRAAGTMVRRLPALLLSPALLAASALAGCSGGATSAGGGAVDASGALRVPANYRQSYQGIGSWSVAADSGTGAKELHIVYASPGTASAYSRTGHFPDGAVLVKEVFATATAPMTTGTVSRADTLKGWFVMVRDGKNTHPGDKRWGDGWGWAWFDAGKPDKTETTDYRSACLTCHEPARKTELSYTIGYPAFAR